LLAGDEEDADVFALLSAVASVVAFIADEVLGFDAAALATVAAFAGSMGTHSPFLHRPPPSFT
jgi:hypothetical protein